jgi:pilus assembly protein CpaB
VTGVTEGPSGPVYRARMRAFSLRRRIPTSSKLLFVSAGVCALGSFLIVQGYAARAAQAGRGEGPTVPVLVAARAIDAGATIGTGDVRVAQVPAAYAPPAGLASVDDALGRTAGGPFLEGQPVPASWLGAASLIAFDVPVGWVGVAGTFATLPEGLTTSDHVDVLGTFSGARPYTSTIAEDVRVLRIGDVAEAPGGIGGRGTKVTLLLTPDQARELVRANTTGALALTVRGAQAVAASPSAAPSATTSGG